MSIKIYPTTLEGVLKIIPSVFEDYRGEYIETYNEKAYRAAGIDLNFVQDDISISRQHVLRGLHGDQQTWKLVTCLAGSFYLMVLNWDEASPQYRKWESFTLSDKSRTQILIPPKFGNAHVVLTDTAIFHYKQTGYYDRASQFTVCWDDPELNMWWPITNPILSKRDTQGEII